jgi:NCS1 family nucleobase:cation symporter-1
MTETIQHEDGRVELQPAALEEISASPLYNDDLAPVPVGKRNWTTYNYAALWISMAHCIPTYMMASGLISAGMNWWQALLTILLGNIIVLGPILLNSHPGTKYGIPFPVFARAAYGTYGSNLPAIMRALVACGWFGIQAWIGGQAIHIFLSSIVPGWQNMLGGPIGGHTPTQWLSFLIFWGMNIFIIYRGMDLLRHVENWAAPFVLVMTAILLAWILYQAGGVGFLLHEESKFKTTGEFWKIFIPSLTAMIGFWATLSLNMPDFTRFGKSQREQAIGQTVALPTTMVLFAAMGILITSAAVVVFPHMKPDELWDPVKLVGQFSQPLVVAISMFTVVVATLSVNIAANVVSPANDFANAFPKWISFRTGGLITGIIGILMQPWKLLADPSGYIFSWLLGYSGGLGSIAGVLIADYWLIRRKNLHLGDLYRTKGTYKYLAGWNWRAVIATLLGCFFAWSWWIVQGINNIWPIWGPFIDTSDDIVVRTSKLLFDYAWFVGFGVAFLTHWVLMKIVPPEKMKTEI